jgi:hypothetical protein
MIEFCGHASKSTTARIDGRGAWESKLLAAWGFVEPVSSLGHAIVCRDANFSGDRRMSVLILSGVDCLARSSWLDVFLLPNCGEHPRLHDSSSWYVLHAVKTHHLFSDSGKIPNVEPQAIN